MKKRYVFILTLSAALLLAGCSEGTEVKETGENTVMIEPVGGEPGGNEKEGNMQDDTEKETPGVTGTVRPVYGEEEDVAAADLIQNGAIAGNSGSKLSEGAELMCLAADEQEAQEIAKLYNIELTGFDSGVACFTTDEDPQAVIKRGKENGYPLLELNRIIELDDPVQPGGHISIKPDF